MVVLPIPGRNIIHFFSADLCMTRRYNKHSCEYMNPVRLNSLVSLGLPIEFRKGERLKWISKLLPFYKYAPSMKTESCNSE